MIKRGMIESKCHIDPVANGDNLPKGSAIIVEKIVQSKDEDVKLIHEIEAQGNHEHSLTPEELFNLLASIIEPHTKNMVEVKKNLRKKKK